MIIKQQKKLPLGLGLFFLLVMILMAPHFQFGSFTLSPENFFIISEIDPITGFEPVNITPSNKVLASWDLTGTTIVIDNNGGTSGAMTWSEASSQPWCTLINGVYIIENVTIDGQNTDHCIKIMDSSDPFIIRQCTLFNAPFLTNKACINLASTSNGLITNNNCSTSGGHGIYLLDHSNSNEILNNHIESVTRGIYVRDHCENNSISGNTILDSDYGGIYVHTLSHNNRIIGNNISQSVVGINTQDMCNNVSIIDNHISSGTGYGIGLGYSNYSIIAGNTIENIDENGISLWNQVKDTVISHNEIIGCGDSGIYCYRDCKNLIIEKNVINGGMYGIKLDGCSNNIIRTNDISKCISNAIALIDYEAGSYLSLGNTITKNHIHNQSNGIVIGYQCIGNTISENAILCNSYTARSDAINSWDNGEIGNYYSDFSGTDANNDGISDISHTLIGSAGSVDNFPLVYNPAFGEKIHIDDSSVSALTWENTKKVMWWLEKGTGTESDPYIIEDLTIDAGGSDDCIKIENSSVHFTIQNCLLTNAGTDHHAGVQFDTVSNGLILNNTITNNLNLGIEFYQECHFNNVTGNTIGFNGGHGLLIRVGSSSNHFYLNKVFNHTQGIRTYQAGVKNSFDSNLVFNNSIGLFLHVTSNSTVINNDIFQSLVGIYIKYSPYTLVTNNYIFHNSQHGIHIYSSSRLVISENVIEDHIYEGIRLSDSSKNCSIFNNIIQKSNRYGIFLEQATANSTIFSNTFVGNALNAKDNGTTNYWSQGSTGNLWDDYFSTDPDDDGVGEAPYPIAGSAGSIDLFPQFWDPITLKISEPSTGASYGSIPPSFELSFTDGVPDKTWYSLDSGLYNETLPSGTKSISEALWSIISDGEIQITFYSNDSRGFISSDQILLVKDSVIPSLSIISPTIGQEFTSFVPIFSITVDDQNLESIWYTVDGGLANYTCGITGSIDNDLWVAQPNGVITITFYASDSAGNVGSVNILVYKNSSATTSTTTTTEQTTEDSTTETQSSENITSETTPTSQPQTTISAPGFSLFSIFLILPLLSWINRRTKR